MQHFSLEEWADFAREAVGHEKKAAMQSHLKTGCKKCTMVYGLWRRVNEAARRENAYEPPETAVRTVKGLGAIHGIGRPQKASSPLAELLFDSFRGPLVAGVRSTTSTASARQLLYGAGSYRIDVRMEPLADSEKAAVVGQVLNAADPTNMPQSLPVILFKGNKILTVSQTNSFGEFHLECDLHADLKLQLQLTGGKDVWIPLVNPSAVADSTHSIGVKRVVSKARKSTRKKV